MAKTPRRVLQQQHQRETHHHHHHHPLTEIESQPTNSFLKSAQEFIADAYTGRDVTRPRDLYTFLSLGHIPPSRNKHRPFLKSRSVNTDRRVTFGLPEVITRRKSFGETPSTPYLQLDLRKSPFAPLPSINASLAGDEIENLQQYETNDLRDEGGVRIPISVLKGYHKVNIRTTYIFAPSERLQETVKYNNKVVLPNISPNGTLEEEIHPPSVLTIDSNTNLETLHRSKFEVVHTSPRERNNQAGNHIFGARPECIFINTQLGDKNPMLRDQAKLAMSSKVPKAVPGLQDLKDYEGYPDIYWKLRAETIAQPEDLEADMIDRDLYRLRQISTLRLNTVEKRFNIKQDPFRKWRGKAGEPLFSPKQQKTGPQRRRLDKIKATELNLGNHQTNTSPNQLSLGVTITPLRMPESEPAVDHQFINQEAFSPRKDMIDGNDPFQVEGHSPVKQDRTVPGLPDLPNFDTPREPSTDLTPRETVEASLNTYRQLQKERESEGNFNFTQVPVQKLHQLKHRRDHGKKAIKTSLVKVDLEPIEIYNKQHGNAARYQNNATDNAALNSNSLPLSSIKPKDFNASVNADGGFKSSLESKNVCSQNDNSVAVNVNAKQKQGASVAALLFKPPPDHSVPGSYPDHLCPSIISTNTNIINGETVNSQQQSLLEVQPKERTKSLRGSRRNSSNTVRATHLEVFGERRDDRDPIKIPTGRTSYHPEMPAYRLDLMNYPPSNARQVCHRFNSAGPPESRQTDLTQATAGSLNPELTSLRVYTQTSIGNTRSADPLRPPRSADAPAVDIRFAGNGEVILSSSKEKRGGRASR